MLPKRFSSFRQDSEILLKLSPQVNSWTTIDLLYFCLRPQRRFGNQNERIRSPNCHHSPAFTAYCPDSRLQRELRSRSTVRAGAESGNQPRCKCASERKPG